MKPPRYVILLGPPGCGKGTQAKKIQKHYHLAHISTGDCLRKEIAKGTPLGIRLKEIMDKGDFPTNEEVTEVLEIRMQDPDCAPGVIFDGYPRTIPQAEYLEGQLKFKPTVIHLSIPEEIIAERIVYRRSCPKCGAVYHLKYQPPKRKNTCDRDGETLVQRKDDTANVLSQRLELYHKLTAPILDFYQNRGLLQTLETDQLTPDQVFEKIKVLIDKDTP